MNAPVLTHGACRTLALFALFALLMLVAVAGCECAPATPPNQAPPVGQVAAVPVDGGFEIRLSGLERPVRSLQVDVKIDGGARATAATAIGGSDVVEADLGEGKSEFTVVVADTRRLNLPSGGVAFVSTGLDLGPVTLSRALAVDDAGALRSVNVVVP